MVPVYAKGSHVVVIVFDQSKLETFEHVEEWNNFIASQEERFKYILLVANKSDLTESINIEKAYLWAKNHNTISVRTSTIDGTNIVSLFNMILKALYELYQEMQQSDKAKGNNFKNDSEKSEDVNIVKIAQPQKKSKKKCY